MLVPVIPLYEWWIESGNGFSGLMCPLRAKVQIKGGKYYHVIDCSGQRLAVFPMSSQDHCRIAHKARHVNVSVFTRRFVQDELGDPKIHLMKNKPVRVPSQKQAGFRDISVRTRTYFVDSSQAHVT